MVAHRTRRTALITLAVAGVVIARWLAPHRALDLITVDPQHVHGYTADGRELWSYAVDAGNLTLSILGAHSRATAVDDIDGDGHREALVSVNVRGGASDPRASRLLCLDEHGGLRWSVALDDEVQFGTRRFGPPWAGVDVMTFGQGRKTIVFTARQQQTWPSLLITLDPDGARTGRFAHAGRLTRAEASPDGRHVFVAGISQSHGAPALAVLASTQIDGHSPAPDGDEYDCGNCGIAPPERYFVVPHDGTAPGDDVSFDVEHAGSEIRLTRINASTDAPELLLALSDTLNVLRASRSVLAWTPQHGWLRITPPS